MMIKNRPCVASKATTITFPVGGFLRDACIDASVSIDGISPMRKFGPGSTSLQATSNSMSGSSTSGGRNHQSNVLSWHPSSLLEEQLFSPSLVWMLILSPMSYDQD